jgi:hypothetical protein
VDGPAIGDAWTDTCLARADRRAGAFLALTVLFVLGVVLALVLVHHTWVYLLVVLLVPLCVELSVPCLRHFLRRAKIRRMLGEHSWHPVSARFVPGRARVGRQTYLEMAGSDRSYLRLPEMPERARDRVRLIGQVWMAGPDERGLAVVVTDKHPFMTLGRVVIR